MKRVGGIYDGAKIEFQHLHFRYIDYYGTSLTTASDNHGLSAKFTLYQLNLL